MPNGTCQNVLVCGRESVPLTAGLCRGCYHRQRRRGTLKPAYGRNGDKCRIEGCDLRPFAKGMCSRHYQQNQHPITTTWKLIRTRHPGEFPESWKTREGMLADVGDRPSPKHQLRRINADLPWSAENCEWRPPIRVDGKTGVTANMAAYQRAWTYLRKFGVTEEDLRQIEEDQHGDCPICTKALKMNSPVSGKAVRICLDHDHVTGKVRGLLHDNCNKALGQLDDDPASCRRAAAYLEAHAAKPNPAA